MFTASAGLPLLTHWGRLVIRLGMLAAVMIYAENDGATSRSAVNGQDRVPESAPSDSASGLAYIPRNALAVVLLRPASLLENTALAPLHKAIPPLEAQGLELGVKPQEITSVRVVVLTVPGVVASSVLMVEMQTPEAVDRFIMAQGQNWEPKSCAGQDFFCRENAAYFKSNDRTVVFSRDEASLVRSILAGPTGASTAKWFQAWRAAASFDAAAIVNTSLLRCQDLSFVQSLLYEFQEKVAPNNPLLRTTTRVAALWQESEYAIAALRTEDEIRLHLLNQSATENEAVEVQNALMIVNSVARMALSDARRSIVLQPESVNLDLLKQIDLIDELLEHLVVARQGTQVRATVLIDQPTAQTLSRGAGLATQAAQKVGNRRASLSNLKRIAQGFQSYHNTYRSLPMAVQIGPNNVPRSWRVTLLPFLGYKELHKAYRQDEPWDSDHNKTILAQMPDVYRCPADTTRSTNSSYFVFTGPESLFGSDRDRKYADIIDGMRNTILAVESKRDVPWTKPDEIPFAPKGRVSKPGGWYPDGFNAVTCAGDTQFFPLDFDEVILRYLIMHQDGQPAQMPQPYVPEKQSRTRR